MTYFSEFGFTNSSTWPSIEMTKSDCVVTSALILTAAIRIVCTFFGRIIVIFLHFKTTQFDES